MSLVNLESSDGVVYSLPSDVAALSSLVQDVIMHCQEDGGATIPLPKVPNVALGPVVEWMRRKKQVSSQFAGASGRCTHGNKGSDYDGKDSELSNWERTFFHDLNKDVLFMVLNTANYMGIAGLVAAGSSFIAEMISVQ
ncbi:Skp1 family, tetramerization domain protein [Ostertagia ostertagi]